MIRFGKYLLATTCSFLLALPLNAAEQRQPPQPLQQPQQQPQQQQPIPPQVQQQGGKNVRGLKIGGGAISIALSPDGKTVATGSQDRVAKIWDSTSGKEACQMTGHGSWVMSVNFSADGKTVITGGADATVRLWDAAGGKELRQFRANQTWICSVALSADGKKFASGSYDETVSIWDAAAGKESFQLGGHDGPITALAFSEDGKSLASGSEDKVIVLWDAATGKERCRLPGHDGTVSALAFSPDGRLLASGGADRSVRLWELNTGKECHRFAGHPGPVSSLRFSQDGKTLIALSTDIRTWDIAALAKNVPQEAVNRTPQELDALWKDLAAEDAAKGFQAVRNLAAAKQVVPLLQERLRPAVPPDPQRIAAWIADLDSDEFPVRDKASQELRKLGAPAAPALRKALENQPSAEVRRRVEQLLNHLEQKNLSQESLQMVRAVEVLELIRTPEARQLLEKLAQGAPNALVTEEAKLALQRLDKPKSAQP